MSIGERITELRKQHELSQGQIADALGVSRQAVSKWENDLTSPDTLKLIKLADLLDTEVAYLATGKMPVYEKPIVLNIVKREEKIVEVEKIVEKPVIRKIIRFQYRRNWFELLFALLLGFLAGVYLGSLL